jgi:amino acid permease
MQYADGVIGAVFALLLIIGVPAGLGWKSWRIRNNSPMEATIGFIFVAAIIIFYGLAIYFFYLLSKVHWY